MTAGTGVVYLTTTEAAKRMQLSEDYVSRLCAKGALRAAKVGNKWRIHPDAVDEFLKAEPDPDAVRAARPDLTKKQQRAVDQRVAAAFGLTP